MSDIVGELARVNGAFEQPTLRLLHQRHAAVVIAIFRSSFNRETRSIHTARLHDHVDTYMEELRQAGHRDLPAGSGRDLCLRWMHGQWLIRSTEEEIEVYILTSHAQDALNLVTALTRERASLSEHRIATIVNAVRRFNAEVNPDRTARVAILRTQIAQLTRERDRLLAGGQLAHVSDDYMLEGFVEILQLIAALPSDFARVEEAFTGLRHELLDAFRKEERPAGEVIDSYLARTDSLMTATAEGRAFEGAFALLRDDELLHQLRQDLNALLGHPLADDILQDTDRRELRGTVALIRAGINSVLAQRNRVSATLRDYIVNHDVERDSELDTVLRQLETELATWMRTAGPRASVPLALLPERVEVGHLRQRFYDPATDIEPPPLQDVSADRPDRPSLLELLQEGGPCIRQLRHQLSGALAVADPDWSLGDLFESLPPELRRPVEIFGLLHLATNACLDRDEATETYRTVRPDGTTRDLAVPRVVADSTKETS